MSELVIILPSFNDWESLSLLLPQLDRALAEAGRTASVLVVDDASTEPMPANWPSPDSAPLRWDALRSVEILNLRCNLGHQRAIALGLYHVSEYTPARAVAIMDADGEDRPQDLPCLLTEFEKAGGREIVFAARTRRMESGLFRLSYRAYRLIHRLLTGIEVRVGNFSVIPRESLFRLIAVPDLWNHYAAAVYRARLPRRLLPLPRGRRLAGTSKMNFVSLLIHGLTAMSVFSDQVSARLLTAAAAFAALSGGLIVWAVCVRLFTYQAIPGWATYTVGVLAGLVVQSLAFAILFSFLIASRRSAMSFVLQRDAPYFLLGKTSVFQRVADRVRRAL